MKSILIVDDSEPDRYIATRITEKSGLVDHIYSLSDGEEALNHFSNFEDSKKQKGDNFPPSAIILDINMPKMDGPTFLERVQNMFADGGPYANTVVAILSSSQNDEDMKKTTRFPFVKLYLSKPFKKEYVDEIISCLD